MHTIRRALHSDAAGDGSLESRRLFHALLIRTAPDVCVLPPPKQGEELAGR
jgi:hypothetical protein